LRGIVSTPSFEMRQPAATTLLAAEDYIDDSPANGPQAVAQRALTAIRGALHGGEGIALEDVTAGLRPMPGGGLPIVGGVASVPGLYLAVMHAGIILAPTVGRLVAAEILSDRDDAALAHCRPDRFVPGR
ncbi:MAG: FAD-dependent oxidoreductase, partial [Dongiaceae bacterium]